MDDAAGGRATAGRGVPLDAAAVAFLGGGFVLSTRAVSWNVKAVATLLLLGYLAVSYFADGENAAAGRGVAAWVNRVLRVAVVG